MALIESTFTERVSRWQAAEPGELAPNFHALESGGSDIDMQFVKATEFILSDLDMLKALDINEMFLWMALNEFSKYTISFQPILEVVHSVGTGETARSYLEFDTGMMDTNGTEPVPTPFVRNVTALWRDLESDKLPDVFVTTNIEGIRRVRYFMIEGIGLDLIKTLLPKSTMMRIIPGVDLTKKAFREEVLFVPIINLQIPNLKETGLDTAHHNDLHGVGWSVNDGDDDDVFFDYSKPCPPVCNNH